MIWRVLVALLLIGGQAHALSCLPPNLAMDFNNHAESKHDFRIVVGQLKTITPWRVIDGEYAEAKARLKGRALGADGLGPPETSTIVFSLDCLGGRCVDLNEPGEDYVVEADDIPPLTSSDIIFLSNFRQGFEYYLGPCEFSYPYSVEAEALLSGCLARGRCTDQEVEEWQESWD